MIFCELCGWENECTCGGCQCKWCRDRRGEYVSPMERAQIDAHDRAHKNADHRKAIGAIASGLGQKLKDYKGPKQ